MAKTASPPFETASPVSAITGGSGAPASKFVTSPEGMNGAPPVITPSDPTGHGATPGQLAAGTQPMTPQPAAPNGLAAFANSAFGKYLASMNGVQPSQAQNYQSAFQGALGNARSDIAQQLSGALSDIKNNQAYAQQALSQLPGQINQSYGTADQLMKTGQNVAQQGMNAPGLNAATAANTGGSLNQYMAPERAAIAGEKAGEQANVPLLATGIQQAGSQEAAAANNAALSDYGNLAQQQAQLQGQAQIAAMGQQSSLAAQQAQDKYGIVTGALQNAYTLAQIKASNTGGSATYGGLTQGQVAQVVSSPQYADAVSKVQGGAFTTLKQIQAAYPTNPALWQTVASQYGLK